MCDKHKKNIFPPKRIVLTGSYREKSHLNAGEPTVLADCCAVSPGPVRLLVYVERKFDTVSVRLCDGKKRLW